MTATALAQRKSAIDQFALRVTQFPFFIEKYSQATKELPPSKLIIAHRRAGKSFGLALQVREEAIKLYNHDEIFRFRGDVDTWNPTMYYLAPTKVQARDIIWPYIKRFLQPLPGARVFDHTLSVTIPRPKLGDEINFRLKAARQHDAVRGSKLWRAWLDEGQDSPPTTIPTSLQPALEDLEGLLTVTATVKGRNHLFDMANLFIDLNYPFYIFPVTRTGVFSREKILRLKAESLGGSFEREYMCSFDAPVIGALFAEKLKLLEMEPWFFSSERSHEGPLVCGLDIGIAKGFAAWVGEMVSDTQVNILQYYEDYNNMYDFRCDLEDDNLVPDYIFSPHDSNTRVFSAYKETKNQDILKEIFPDVKLRAVAKPNNAMAMIENTNRHLHLLRFPDQGSVNNDCVLGYSKLKEYAKKIDESSGVFLDGIDKKNDVSHAGDAMRTLITGLKCRDGRIKFRGTYRRTEGRTELNISRNRTWLNDRGNVMGGMSYGQATA